MANPNPAVNVLNRVTWFFLRIMSAPPLIIVSINNSAKCRINYSGKTIPAWLDKVKLFGPGEEVGVLEDAVEDACRDDEERDRGAEGERRHLAER